MQKFYYCDKCGFISTTKKEQCWCCNNTNYVEIPEKYGVLHWGINDWDNREIIDEEVIKKSPNLDLYYFEHRNEIIKQKNDVVNAATEHGKEILGEQNRTAHCPSCGSKNVSNCFLQALFGQSCKIFLDIVACPNWTKLQSLG